MYTDEELEELKRQRDELEQQRDELERNATQPGNNKKGSKNQADNTINCTRHSYVAEGAFGHVIKCDGYEQYVVKYIKKARNINKNNIKDDVRRHEEELILERELMFSIAHKHIVKAFAKKVKISKWDVIPDYAYMVLEYCNGGDLHSLLNRKKYNINEILNKFVYGIGSALQYIHTQDIIHHDLKPENIFVSIDPDTKLHILKLGDFGLYSKVDESYKPMPKGTELYLPFYQLISNNTALQSEIYYHKNAINFTSVENEYVPIAKYFIDWYAYICIIYDIITKALFNTINKIQAIIFNTCCINLNLIQDTILCNILMNIMCIDIQVYFTGVDDLSNKYYKLLFDLIENKNEIHIASPISDLKTKLKYSLSYDNTKKLYSLENTNTKKNITYNKNTPEEIINEIYLLNPKDKNNNDIVVRKKFNDVGTKVNTPKNNKKVNSTKRILRLRSSTKKNRHNSSSIA